MCAELSCLSGRQFPPCVQCGTTFLYRRSVLAQIHSQPASQPGPGRWRTVSNAHGGAAHFKMCSMVAQLISLVFFSTESSGQSDKAMRAFT